jgi:WD40 repeat protein
MPAGNVSPHGKTATGPRKWIVWALILGAVVLGLVALRVVTAGGFMDRGTSGKCAKFQFALHDTLYSSSVAWSPDGQYIATASNNDSQEIHIWDVSQRKIVRKWRIPFGTSPWFHELAFSPDGKYLAACDGTGVLRVYQTGSWALAHVFSELHELGGCDHPVFSGDSKRIAMVSPRFLLVVSVPDWRVVKHLELDRGWGRGNLFNAVAYVPNTHTVLVSGGQHVTITLFGKKQESWDGRVWFFEPVDQTPSKTIRVYRPYGVRGGGGSVTVLSTSPDGRYLVTGAETGAGNASSGTLTTESVHILRASDGSLVAEPLDGLLALKFPNSEAIAYTHDGRYIIVPHDGVDGWIHVLDGRTFKVLDLVRSNAFTFDVAVNTVNDDIAVGTGKQVMVWALPER